MAVVIEDILQANLVFVGVELVNTNDKVLAFRKQVGPEVITAESVLGTEVIERTLTLSRDRITVRGTPQRSVIVRERPSENDLGRFAQIAGLAIANTELQGQKLQAFGYNIELVYEPSAGMPAIQYLSERLFKTDLLREGGRRLFGGAGRLFFKRCDHNWQVKLEPRLNDESTSRIFASLNLHRSESDIAFPTEAEIGHSLALLWAEAHSLVNELDESTQ